MANERGADITSDFQNYRQKEDNPPTRRIDKRSDPIKLPARVRGGPWMAIISDRNYSDNLVMCQLSSCGDQYK